MSFMSTDPASEASAPLRTAGQLLLWISTGLLSFTAQAQSPDDQPRTTLGGLTYLDYQYRFAPEDVAGDNGFVYRRLYLTADYRIDDQFSGRARLEINDDSAPNPFLKDLSLAWTGLGGGHTLVAGVTPPPIVIETTENVWGYRSLAPTLLDRIVLSSRMFGVRASGPLTTDGTLHYGLAFANNASNVPELDQSKQVFAGLRWRPAASALLFSSTFNYAAAEQEDDAPNPEEHNYTGTMFASYTVDQVRVGVEGFWRNTTFEEGDLRTLGASLFAVLAPAPDVRLIGRVDLVDREVADAADRWFLLGVSYRVSEQVEFIPNLVFEKRADSDLDALGRLTLFASF